ncbi:MAG: tail fiber domain-containing protein [Bacteroidota bacterium]
MKRFVTAIFALLFAVAFQPSNAQDAGAPDGQIQFNTNLNGRTLGHLQNGNFGDVMNPVANWTAIGQSPFPPIGAPYGIRLQRSGQLAVFNLLSNPLVAPSPEELIIGFGEDPTSNLRIRYISDQMANTFDDLIVASANGSVGIGKDPDANFALDVQGGNAFFGAGVRADYNGFGFPILGEDGLVSVYGVNEGVGGLVPYGVFGRATAQDSSGSSFGAFGSATGATVVAYGVYGQANQDPGDWAGYFVGRTFCTAGMWTASDRRLKTEIRPEKSALDRIMSLKSYTYKYDRASNPELGLARGLQHGFLAQELETVFPEMVTEVNHTIVDQDDPSQIERVKYKGVSYDQMVPVLTAAMQEQQAVIEEQSATIVEQTAQLDALLARIEALEKAASGASKFDQLQGSIRSELFQNAPNPFNERTVIGYRLPAGKTATIYVFDMNGRQIREFDNLRGEELVIEGSQLEAGMYFYNLVVDGQEIDMKRMVLTK